MNCQSCKLSSENAELRAALAFQQEIINRSNRPWWRWLREEVLVLVTRHGAAQQKKENG